MDEPACATWSSARILLVGCDGAWARRAHEELAISGFDVETLLSVDDVLTRATTSRPDLVAVDLWSAPDAGVTMCALLRARTTASVVAIGRRASDDQVLSALDAGADTFVPRDASPRELVARVRALLRRLPPERPVPVAPRTDEPVSLDPERGAALVAGETVSLAEPEFFILEALLRTPGRAVSRRELAESYGGSSSANALDRHIRRIRQKLEAGDDVRRLTAVRGMGFRFVPGDPTTGEDAASQ